ncbi:MAG: AbrB/MazE/SpoVT family DNA-binding domain-containing protein [Euryarchaeota archaeon]|nr:AbrB/MazE/SpoVT family DNA-binding domain-containing protein [Euryarchaeota archaeon]
MDDIATVDKQGRVYLPKDIREKAGVEPGTRFHVETEGERIILEKRRSIVRESRGIFRTKKPIDDVDRVIKEAVQEIVEKEL